jgi:hypothetical protein
MSSRLTPRVACELGASREPMQAGRQHMLLVVDGDDDVYVVHAHNVARAGEGWVKAT